MSIYSPLELDRIQADLPYLLEILQWTKSFLGAPHRDLGRSGPVCPFVPKALQLDSIRLSVIHSQGLSFEEVETLVRSHQETFLSMEPREGDDAIFKAMLLIFPDVSSKEAKQFIDELQQKLKPAFVESGLMIGEFHSQNDTPGLHNPNFRPLRSPIPMLAIRYMHESDLPFLNRPTDTAERRVKYLQAYLNRIRSWSNQNAANLETAEYNLALAKSEVNSVPIDVSLATTHSEPKRCPFAKLLRLS